MTTLSFESGNGGDSGNGQLLRDIEEISKALYLPKAPQRGLISSFNVGSESAEILPLVSYSKSKFDPGLDDDGDRKITKDKKSSVWPWKPLKAISHMRQRKFNCCFFCHVHHIENLPSSFDGYDMSVHWKRKDNLVSTLSSRVCNGFVEFEDTLMSRCSVYGARSGQGNFVKYKAKYFLLFASIVGIKGLDIGKHWIDLTRLLPLVSEELEEDKCSGKWTTSFKLGGKAEGATMHVSFGFLVMNNSSLELGNGMRSPLVFNLKQPDLGIVDHCVANCGSGDASGMLRRVASVPSSFDCGSSSSSQSSDVKVLHQVWPNPMSEFSGSVDILYRKLDEDIMDASRKFDSIFENSESFEMVSDPYDGGNEAYGNECVDDDIDAEFTVTEKGIELEWPMAAEKIDISSIEVIDVADIFKDELEISDNEVKLDQPAEGSGGSLATTLPHEDCCYREMELNIEELGTDIWNLFISESVESESSSVGREFVGEEIFEGVTSNPGLSNMVNSLSLDSVMKAVSDDFCRLLGEKDVSDDFCRLLGEKDDSYGSSQSSDHESPRGRLLREFEKDSLGSGSFLYDSDTQRENAEFSFSGMGFSSSESTSEEIVKLHTIHSAMTDLKANQSTTYRTKPNTLECLETQSLMQRWGFSEEAFDSSSDSCTGGFGSPIYLPPEEPAGLPPLAEGLGPLLQLNDGGFLRSMSPSLFIGSKNGGSLIIQVSRPVVLPAAMGFELLEVLQCMASGGLELLTQQAHELMPLNDLSGKIIQTLACSEEMSGRDELYVKLESWGPTTTLSGNGLNLTSGADGSEFQYVSVKELVPLVMDSIESKAIEGLRVQSGMSDLVAPSSISLKSDNNHFAFRKNVNCAKSSEEVGAGLQRYTVNRTGENIESLMALSLPLDEWLRLDSGHFSDGDHKSDTASRIMAAHHTKSCDFSMGKLMTDNMRENASLKCGLLGDDLIVALRVQLRDPLRDFESVGAPMLALIEVRREFDNPGLAIYSEQSAERANLEEDTGECSTGTIFGGECSARFVLKEVHVAGLMIEPGKEEIWASKRQQQSGSRWLLVNNMNNAHRTSKSQLSKSNAITTRVLKRQQCGNILWSISCNSGVGDCLSEVYMQDSCIRNPDVVFS